MNNTSFYSALRISALRNLSSLRASKAWMGLHRCESDAANHTDESVWRRVDDPQALDDSFTAIRVVTAGHLDLVEVACVFCCLGYALRATLAGEEEGMPAVSFVVEQGRVAATVLVLSYDCTKSIRTNPDPKLAFELAHQYVREGTPLRKTSRTGPIGTRLVEGIGLRRVEFYVR